MNNKNLIFIVLCSLFLIGIVSALRVTLADGTSQITFNNNLGDNVSHYIGIENRNSFPIDITIEKPSDLLITFYDNTSFSLQPNETKNIPYSIIINATGNYSKEIGVLFEGNGSSFSPSVRLLFNIFEETQVEQEIGQETEQDGTNNGVTNSPKKEKISVQERINLLVTAGECSGDSCNPLDNKKITDNPNLIKIVIGLIIILVIIIVLATRNTLKKKKNGEPNKDKAMGIQNGRTI